jgi:acyl carrier protein
VNFEDKLIEYIQQELLDGSLDIESGDNLLADGMVDSLGMLRLVMHIEQELNIKIPHEDLVIENFRTVGIIINYLINREVLQKNAEPAA